MEKNATSLLPYASPEAEIILLYSEGILCASEGQGENMDPDYGLW